MRDDAVMTSCVHARVSNILRSGSAIMRVVAKAFHDTMARTEHGRDRKTKHGRSRSGRSHRSDEEYSRTTVIESCVIPIEEQLQRSRRSRPSDRRSCSSTREEAFRGVADLLVGAMAKVAGARVFLAVSCRARVRGIVGSALLTVGPAWE